jgi:hypothetical protein
MYLKDKNILFIHIPKTAGKWITNELGKNSLHKYYGHFPYYNWISIHPEINNSTKIFTIIRNPWDKIVSLYYYTLSDKANLCWFSKNDDIDLDFNKWLTWVYKNKEIIKNYKMVENCPNVINNFDLHFSNQTNFIKNNKTIINDNITVFKFEDITNNNEILVNLFRKWGLSHYNFGEKINSSKRGKYTELYNENTKKLVYTHFL